MPLPNLRLSKPLRSDLQDTGVNPKGGLDASEIEKLKGFYSQMKVNSEKGEIGKGVLSALEKVMQDDYSITDPNEFDLRGQNRNTPETPF